MAVGPKVDYLKAYRDSIQRAKFNEKVGHSGPLFSNYRDDSKYISLSPRYSLTPRQFIEESHKLKAAGCPAKRLGRKEVGNSFMIEGRKTSLSHMIEERRSSSYNTAD